MELYFLVNKDRIISRYIAKNPVNIKCQVVASAVKKYVRTKGQRMKEVALLGGVSGEDSDEGHHGADLMGKC